jgi:hypothetical protein
MDFASNSVFTIPHGPAGQRNCPNCQIIGSHLKQPKVARRWVTLYLSLGKLHGQKNNDFVLKANHNKMFNY